MTTVHPMDEERRDYRDLDPSDFELIAANEPSYTAVRLCRWRELNAFADALATNTTIKFLSLSGLFTRRNGGGPALVQYLRLISARPNSLTELELSENCVEDDVIPDLVDILFTRLAVTYCCLSNNRITSAGLDIFAAAAHATALEFDSNPIFSLSNFASVLARNTTLTSVSFCGCPIDDSCASPLTDMLKQNTSLKVLDLRDTTISDCGLCELAAALPSNTTLKSFACSFFSGYYSSQTMDVVRTAMEHNFTLDTFYGNPEWMSGTIDNAERNSLEMMGRKQSVSSFANFFFCFAQSRSLVRSCRCDFDWAEEIATCTRHEVKRERCHRIDRALRLEHQGKFGLGWVAPHTEKA